MMKIQLVKCPLLLQEDNHNFVMLGYFVTTEFFTDMTNINLKQILFDQKIQEIEEDVVPFGFIDDGQDFANESEKPNWYIEYDV